MRKGDSAVLSKTRGGQQLWIPSIELSPVIPTIATTSHAPSSKALASNLVLVPFSSALPVYAVAGSRLKDLEGLSIRAGSRRFKSRPPASIGGSE